MKTSNRFWRLALLLPAVLFLNACSNTGGSERPQVSGTVQTVYGGYGYPYYGYYAEDYYEDRVEHIEERREKIKERLQNRPDTQPQPLNNSRQRTSTRMGRPSQAQMGARTPRMPRGGGLRRR